MQLHRPTTLALRASWARLRASTLAFAAAASLCAPFAQAQTGDASASASPAAQLDPADAPKPAPNNQLGIGLDQQTQDQTAQASRIQQRMADIGRLPNGVSSWTDAMVLDGDFGQGAKFNKAVSLHRWGIVGGMVGGYLLWFVIGVAVLSILGRLTRARPSR